MHPLALLLDLKEMLDVRKNHRRVVAIDIGDVVRLHLKVLLSFCALSLGLFLDGTEALAHELCLQYALFGLLSHQAIGTKLFSSFLPVPPVDSGDQALLMFESLLGFFLCLDLWVEAVERVVDAAFDSLLGLLDRELQSSTEGRFSSIQLIGFWRDEIFEEARHPLRLRHISTKDIVLRLLFVQQQLLEFFAIQRQIIVVFLVKTHLSRLPNLFFDNGNFFPG